jgi:hypothetical protein
MVGVNLAFHFLPATFRGLICGSPPGREDEAVRCPALQTQVGRRSAHLLLICFHLLLCHHFLAEDPCWF